MAGKSSRFTIFLIKPDLAYEQIMIENCESVQIDQGYFYTSASIPHEPDWLKTFFKGKITGKKVISSSARGVLLTTIEAEAQKYTFAVVFGHGRHLLRDDVVEDRFGLKVVLNSVREKSLRSIDKVNLGSFAKQSREQIGREGGADSFGIDVEQDLVRAVTGRSKIAGFGKMISGKDAFATTAQYDIEDVSDLLNLCIKQYQSKEYEVDFDWIDQLEDVRSAGKVASLNKELVERIGVADYERVWLVPPDILDWADIAGFKYARPKRGDLYDDLAIADLVTVATDDGKVVDLDWLQKTSVYAISEKDDQAHIHWAAFKCIYAEITIEQALYILNAGKWYKVAEEFTKTVLDDYLSLSDSDVDFIEYSHKDEAAYNKALSEHLLGSACLDANVIHHGGGKSSIEFCDVLTSDKRLLHVKRYSGSAQLSHLFAQGAVSAELFVSDGAFRAKLNEKLPDALKLANVTERPNASQYEVVYAIISKSQKPLDIPFFSKVTLRNAARRLSSFGFKVTKLKVSVIAP